jgi:tripartite-type tricarboxylate transporter receptor subunit TctC
LRWVLPQPPGSGTNVLTRTLAETLRSTLGLSIVVEMFKQRTKMSLVHIPDRGAAPAMQNVMSGQVPVMFLDLAAGLITIQGAKVRAIACGGKGRPALLPGVPRLIEENVREVEAFAFQAQPGPDGRQPATVQRLNGELHKALANTTVVKRFLDLGMEPMPGTHGRFRAFARNEAGRGGLTIRDNGNTLNRGHRLRCGPCKP